jgi:CheY-like chemotaxis protein
LTGMSEAMKEGIIVKKILIVDDDPTMIQYLKEGLMRYEDTFMVLTAEDGLEAVDRLKDHAVSIVVTDLRMPRMDGFSLLTHVMAYYPEIPVIIITGFSTQALEQAAQEGGAVGYISKPFVVDELAEKILTTLRKEADGGTLHSISSGMFLQLLEMEEKSCTIRVISKPLGRQGVLFFSHGDLLDARVEDFRGEEAACEILSWDEVSLSIQNSCRQTVKQVHRSLQAILFEAALRKDDRRSQVKGESLKPEKANNNSGKKRDLSPEGIKTVLAKHFPEGAGVEDIYQDETWKGLVGEVQRLAGLLKAGDFKAAYVDQGDDHSFIILPGESVTVVSVNPKCPRDRLVETLSELPQHESV